MTTIKFDKILLTHDGSKLSNSAVPYAISLAKKYDSKILLLHVVNSIDQEMAFYATPGMYPAVLGTAANDIVEQNKKWALIKMQKIKDDLESNKITVKLKIVEGSSEDVIVDEAKKEKCDIIIMSTHGRGGLSRAMMGSVTDHVLRHAHCPVLTVHPKK